MAKALLLMLFWAVLGRALGDDDALSSPSLKEPCVPLSNRSYFIEDTQFCDIYHECPKSGKVIKRYCEDGFVFSSPIHQCDYEHNVDCSERPSRLPTKSHNPLCARLNGFYAFPAQESCQKFYHCLEGEAYEKTCPEGVIFDTSKATCMHPDLSNRADCTAAQVLKFECPNANKHFARLRFGDHDRHAHPTDCRKFYICLTDGKPRLAGCPIGKVFNPKTGVCDAPKHVPQCKDYYGKKSATKLLAEEEGVEESDLKQILLDADADDDEADDTTANNDHDSEFKSKSGKPKKPSKVKRDATPEALPPTETSLRKQQQLKKAKAKVEDHDDQQAKSVAAKASKKADKQKRQYPVVSDDNDSSSGIDID